LLFGVPYTPSNRMDIMVIDLIKRTQFFSVSLLTYIQSQSELSYSDRIAMFFIIKKKGIGKRKNNDILESQINRFVYYCHLSQQKSLQMRLLIWRISCTACAGKYSRNFSGLLTAHFVPQLHKQATNKSTNAVPSRTGRHESNLNCCWRTCK
jgi:hypothetical protein